MLTLTQELQSAFDVFLCLLQVEIIVSPHNNISVGIVSFTSSDLSLNRMLFSLSLSRFLCVVFFSHFTPGFPRHTSTRTTYKIVLIIPVQSCLIKRNYWQRAPVHLFAIPAILSFSAGKSSGATNNQIDD